jgi:hypothetical protein
MLKKISNQLPPRHEGSKVHQELFFVEKCMVHLCVFVPWWQE